MVSLPILTFLRLNNNLDINNSHAEWPWDPAKAVEFASRLYCAPSQYMHAATSDTVSNSKLRVYFSKNSMFSRRVNMRQHTGLNCNWYDNSISWDNYCILCANKILCGEYGNKLGRKQPYLYELQIVGWGW
jgi:hypothetical protein